ncbi:hypothetical protein ARMSODRAFT_1034391 [Armillaria solidipes]|uniref:Uncharacterized protein n=1 Tax=Armillaria solidipes TaxID=1076256 RepID=A0A2H3B294_9AGAR|nr:hypothetical protein ARMSODRAFT_1034391 [Armillaria solidipes]
MPHYLDLDSCIQAARLIAAAGEMAPFPFVKGAALCVVVILENIQRVTFSECLFGVSGLHDRTPFKAEQQTQVAWDSASLESEEDLGWYQCAIKEDFLIRTTTTTRLVLSDAQDQVTTRFSALAGAVEASERNVTSVIKDNIKEIRTSAVLQTETMKTLRMTLRDFQQRGLYKGVVRDLIPGDIYLKASIPRSCHGGSHSDFDEYHAIIDDRPKLVRTFRVQADQQERVMQLFGVCTSPTFPALIFHRSANIERCLYEVLSNESSVTGALRFFLRMHNDLQPNKLGFTSRNKTIYPERCYNYPGHAGTGRVVADLEEWILCWTINSGQQGLRRLSDPFHRKHPQRLVFSWLAQRSLLSKDPHNSSSVSEDLTFCLRIQPSTNCMPSHALGVDSLSIIFTVPVITSRSPPEMSWPFRFIANGISIPPEDVEEIFRVRINMTCYSTVYVMGTFPFNSIHELSTICGFKPTLDGAEISNDNIAVAINEVPMNSSIEMFDPFKSDTNIDDNAKIHEIAYWDLPVGFDNGSEDQGLNGLRSESDSTHFVEEIDPNFPAGKCTNELDSILLAH